MILRPAALSDLDQIVRLGKQMQAECVTDFPAVEPDKVERHLTLTLNNPGIFMADVVEDAGHLIGLNTAVCVEYAFSTRLRVVGDILFVSGDRRGSVAAKRLIGRMVEWGAARNAHRIVIGSSTGIAEERTGRLFEKLGFARMGTIYSMGIA